MWRWLCAHALSDRKWEKSDLRKMRCVKAESWHELTDGEKGKGAWAPSLTVQGTRDRGTIQGEPWISENLLLRWGNCSLLTGAIFSSLIVGFSSKAFFQETTVAKRSCHWGVDKPKCLLVWIKFWHQVFWIIKALHHPWTPRDCIGRGQWPRFAVYLRECTFTWLASWAKGRNWSPKASLSKTDLKSMS